MMLILVSPFLFDLYTHQAIHTLILKMMLFCMTCNTISEGHSLWAIPQGYLIKEGGMLFGSVNPLIHNIHSQAICSR